MYNLSQALYEARMTQSCENTERGSDTARHLLPQKAEIPRIPQFRYRTAFIPKWQYFSKYRTVPYRPQNPNTAHPYKIALKMRFFFTNMTLSHIKNYKLKLQNYLKEIIDRIFNHLVNF